MVGGGLEAEPVAEDRCNEEVLPGATYTVFLRAFPVSLGEERDGGGSGGEGLGMRGRRQAGGSTGRQYTVFSSSNFIPPVTTGEWVGGR